MKKKQNLTYKTHLLGIAIKMLLKTSSFCTAAILILNVICALVTPINAILYQLFLDSVVKMVEVRLILKSGLTLLLEMALLNLMAFSLNALLNFIKQVFGNNLDIAISDRVLNKACVLPMETFDNAEVYNHINRAISQTSTNCMKLLEAISESLYALVKGLSFLYIIVRFDWKLAAVFLISLLPLLNVSMRINTYWYEIFRTRVERNRLIEYLKILLVKNEYIKEIKLYGVGRKITTFIKDNYTSFLREDISAKKKFFIKRVFIHSIDDVVSFVAKLWLLVLGIRRNCSLGTVVLYFASLDNLKLSYNELICQLSDLQKTLLYLESIDVLEREKVEAGAGSERFDGHFHEIEFRNVSFKYPGCDKYVLKDISLKLEHGKTYFIVGLNGSGKTTLIKLLLRLYNPTEGQILVDGKNIQNIRLEDYYSCIGAIFQDFIKYPFDVYENVVIKPRNEDQGKFRAIMDDVGMWDFVQSLPKKEHSLLMRDWTGGIDISQGQWQKLAIARCMYINGTISILDEPFSSIDAEAENQIISNLRHNSHEKLLIFITHRFSSISPTDKIIVLKEGIIIEEGTHDELINREGMYFKLYVSQKVN